MKKQIVPRCTTIQTHGYTIKFIVVNNDEWLVSIDSSDHTGCTSNVCTGNWNKGLAEAFVTIFSMIGKREADYLLNALLNDWRIDKGFYEYLT